MTTVGIAKAILAVMGIALFLWARNDDQQVLRWIAIGLIVVAWMLRFIERGRRKREEPET